MSTVQLQKAKGITDQKQAEDGRVSKITIVLTSKDCKSIETVCKSLTKRAADKKIKAFGPVRMPTRTLKITTRKSPCGEGTNSWHRFEMKIYKRIIHLKCSSAEVKDVTSIKIIQGVEVELTIDEYDN